MSTRAKLVAFASALAVVFGGAALAGGAVRQLHTPAETNGEMGMKTELVRGLAVSDGVEGQRRLRHSPRPHRVE